MRPKHAASIARRFREDASAGLHDWDADAPDEAVSSRCGSVAPGALAAGQPHVSLRQDGTVDVFQTLNPLVQPHPDSVLSESWVDRPIMNLNSISAFEAIERNQGVGGVYICGSYAVHGMPLLEGAVESAVKACRSLGVEASFWKRAVQQQAERHRAPALHLPGVGSVRMAVCLPSLQVLIVLVLAGLVTLAWYVTNWE